MSEYNFCPSCGSRLPGGASYCPSCGRHLNPVPYPDRPTEPKRLSAREIVDLVGAWGSILLLGLLLFNTFVALWIAPEIFANIGDVGVTLFIMVPLIIEVFRLTGTLAELYYILILIAFLASFALLLWHSRDFASELRGEFKERRTPLFALTTLFAAVYLFNYGFYFLVTMLGAEVETPAFSSLEDWRLLFLLLNAVVYEELISRILLIGVPIAIAILIGRKEGSWYRALFGGTGTGRLEQALVLFSATMFAFGHLEGWDAWKILPTFVGGLALGYLFVRYGVYASIMLHFAVNYLSAPMIYSDSIVAMVMLLFVLLLFLGMGVPFLIIYAKQGLEALIGKEIVMPKREVAEPPKVPEKEEYHLPRPMCPACGQEGAVYSKGEYVCPRCNNRY